MAGGGLCPNIRYLPPMLGPQRCRCRPLKTRGFLNEIWLLDRWPISHFSTFPSARTGCYGFQKWLVIDAADTGASDNAPALKLRCSYLAVIVRIGPRKARIASLAATLGAEPRSHDAAAAHVNCERAAYSCSSVILIFAIP